MRNLKIIVLFVGFLTALDVQLKGQPSSPQSKIQAYKIAYLTDQLDLTPKQAQLFWPLYNQMERKLNALKMAHQSENTRLFGELKNLSEDEISKFIDAKFIYKRKELDIRQEYNRQFKEVLPIRKVAILYRAEESFKRELLKKIRNSHK